MEDSPIRKFNQVTKYIKRGLLIGGSTAMIIATPISVAAHSNRGGDDDRNRDNRGSQQDDNKWGSSGRHNNKSNHPVDPAKCAEWQTRLEEWVANYKATAGKDILLGADYTTMIQTFVTNQGLTVENYDALLDSAEAKKVAAGVAVDAAAAPDLNCENDAAETTERGIDRSSSIKDAKKAMEEYRRSLKELTEAVRASYGGEGMF